MKTRSIFIVILFIGVVVFYWRTSGPLDLKVIAENLKIDEVLKPVSERASTPAETRKSILKEKAYLSKEITQNAEWEKFKDYSLTVPTLIEQASRSDLLKITKKIIKEVPVCLKQDLCGIKPDPGPSYFDPDHTQAHQFLERALGVLVALKESDDKNSLELTREQILELLDINNEIIQVEALELGLETALFQELLGKVSKFHPEAAGHGYALLQNQSEKSPENRDAYMKGLEESLQGPDVQRSLEILDKLKNVKLEENEFLTLAYASCKQKRGYDHNWRAIRYKIENEAKSRGISVSMAELCL